MELRSHLKARAVEQVVVCINLTTHFTSRCKKYCIDLGVEKSDSERVFLGKWDLVPENIASALRAILPDNAYNDNVYIDMQNT